MLQYVAKIFLQAAGLSAVVATAGFGSGIGSWRAPCVASTRRPSPSPAVASCRSNPCLFVPLLLPYSLFCYSLFLILLFLIPYYSLLKNSLLFKIIP